MRRRRECCNGHRFTTYEEVRENEHSEEEQCLNLLIKAHPSKSVQMSCVLMLSQIEQSKALIRMMLSIPLATEP